MSPVMLCNLSGVWRAEDGSSLVRVEDSRGAPLPDLHDDAVFSDVYMLSVAGESVAGNEGKRFHSVMPKHNFHLYVTRILIEETGLVEVMLSLNRRDVNWQMELYNPVTHSNELLEV